MRKKPFFSLYFQLSWLFILITALFFATPVLVYRYFLPLCSSSFDQPHILILHSLSSLFFLLFSFSLIKIVPQEERVAVMGSNEVVNFKKIIHGCRQAIYSYPIFLSLYYLISAVATSLSGKESSMQSALILLESMRGDFYIFVVSAITIVLLGPISEEFFFRGIFEAFLGSFIPFSWSAICSSSLFALFHYTKEQGISNYAILGTLFLFGLFSSYLRRKESHLSSSIGFHVTFNALSFCLFYLRPYI